MSSTLRALRNLWPNSTQDQPHQQQEQQKAATERDPSNTKPRPSPSPSSQEGQKLARARAAVRDGPRDSCHTTLRSKARTPQGFSETRVWMLSRSLSTRRRAEAQLRLRRDEAESRLLADRRSWPSLASLVRFGLRGADRHCHAAAVPAARVPRIPSFQWTGDGGFRAAVVDGMSLCDVLLPAPEDDHDEVESYFLSQGGPPRGHKPPRLSKPLPPPPPRSVPTAPSSIATPPGHLDAIVPSTAAQHLAAYLSLPARLAPQDVVEHVLGHPNLRAAVSRLRAADADLFNSMPWAEIVGGVWDDNEHHVQSRSAEHTDGGREAPCCPETRQAWARLHARNAANKHRRQRWEVVVVAGSGADQDLFPLERRRDQKRRLAALSKAWQRGSPRVTGPAALYRVHDNVGCASSSFAAPGREELVDDVLSWTRPGRSKLREVVVVA